MLPSGTGVAWILRFLTLFGGISLCALGMASPSTSLASSSASAASSSSLAMASKATAAISASAAATTMASVDSKTVNSTNEALSSPSNSLASTASASLSNNDGDETVERKDPRSAVLPALFGQSRVPKNQQRRDPTLLEKLVRRCTVFWVAFRVFGDYKWVGWRARRLKRNLGLSLDDPDTDDHPEVLRLWQAFHQRNASYLLTKIQGLAGFWVKVGQYLSTRADVLPQEYCTRLAALQDSLPPKPLGDVLATLREELDQASLECLASIDPEPLSTASLAQVHRATLKPGVVRKPNPDSTGSAAAKTTTDDDDDDDDDYRHEVVLKVQHRGVASLMLQDMDNLRVILELLAKTDPDLDFGPVIAEYNQEVRRELDFRTEAKNMVEVRDLLKAHNVSAMVPNPIDGLVRERVLVMDFCEGFAVKDLESMDKHGVDRRLLLERICRAWALQMHVGGFFNADPHAGNLLVSTSPDHPDASVPVLLDFGLTKRLDPPMKVAFARLMHSSYEGDVDDLMRSFRDMGLKLNDDDPMEDMANMRRGFGNTVPQTEAKRVQQQKAKDYRQRQQARRDEAGLQTGEKLRSPVEAWPSELVFFGRVTNMLRGLCSQLDVVYPYLQTMAGAARETLKDAVPLDEHAKQAIHHSSGGSLATPLQQRLSQTIEELARNGHIVGLQLCVRKDGQPIANLSAGTLGVANPRPITPTTLFNVFSVSKAVLTLGVLRLVQDGRIQSLDDPVGTYWPAFGATKPHTTIRHLLTHQAGLAHAYPLDATLDTLLDWSGMVDFVATQAQASHPPGAETHYHALTYAWLVGGLIEAVTNQPYEALLEELLAGASVDNTNPTGSRLFLAGISDDVDDDRDLAVLSMDQRRSMPSPTNEPSPKQQKHDSKPKTNAKEDTDKVDTHPKRSEVEETEEELQKRGRRSSLAKYRGLQQLLNPSVFNMRRVRAAKLPSANGHASAESLARLFDAVVRPENPLLAPEVVDEARKPQRASSSAAANSASNNALLNDAQSLFGLGFQLHDFVLKATGQTVTSIGHGGVGGSLVLAVPEEKVVIALTLNQLSGDLIARQTLLGVVFDELGWESPPSLPTVQSIG